MKPGETDDTVPALGAVRDPRVGSSVDKYTVVRLLGRGGMGAVYEARHVVLARRAAIKFLLPQLAENAELLRRFENEAKAAGQLEHPNIAAVIDFGRAADGSPYLLMEYLEGEDCAQLLERHGRLPVARAVDLVVQACRGLAVAHRANIVHRDLKPENLFIVRAGDSGDWVKVLDFGIAKLRPTDGGVPTRTGATLGTAYYMSPEQARGAVDVDRRTDVWSLGVVLYELLSGQRPFGGDQFLHIVHRILSVDPAPLASVQPGLPPALLDVVARAMEKDVERRIASAEELAEALTPFSKREPVELDVSAPAGERLVRTQMTPATSVDGVAIGDTGIRPLTTAEPAVKAARSVRAPVLAAAALLMAAGVTAYASLRPARQPEAGPSIAMSAVRAPVTSAAVAAPPQTASVPEPAAAASDAHSAPSASAVSSAESSRTPGSAPAATHRSAVVRSVSEHLPPSSNSAESGLPPSSPPAVASSPPVAPPAAPARVSRDLAGEKRVIDIEKGNPYE